MRPAVLPPPLSLAPLGFILITSCAQGAVSRSAMEVLSSVVLAGAPADDRSTSAPASATAARVINTADDYLGVPYKWGGNTPSTGFDCSGYVKYVFARQGIALPRTSREQAAAGQAVSARIDQLGAGDIMLFAETNKPISHVAIYAGDGRIIHSSSSGGGVRYDDLSTKRGQWFASHMVKARRLTSNGRSLVQSLDLLTRAGLPFDPPDTAPPPSR